MHRSWLIAIYSTFTIYISLGLTRIDPSYPQSHRVRDNLISIPAGDEEMTALSTLLEVYNITYMGGGVCVCV